MTLEQRPKIDGYIGITISTNQRDIDALYALIYFLEGYERGSSDRHGRVPGYNELVFHYRSLVAAIQEAQIPDEPPF